MQLSDFDYFLPKELIAQYPLKERDSARLLVLRAKGGIIEHRFFRDIVEYLNKDDLLVLNDTRVLSGRLHARRSSGGKVEILLLGRKAGNTFNALIRPARLKSGEKITFDGNGLYGIVNARNEITIPHADIEEIYNLGRIPLPPYIKREPEELDNTYYQTVYAAKDGAVASPTAGLHFTPELLDEIGGAGVKKANITLHIGYSTFKPVKALDIRGHKMGREFFEIGEEAICSIKEARRQGSRIFAVGTTSCRVLESHAAGIKGNYTDLFIYPGYKFKSVDCLLTNFHLPRTTLFMLVAAFAGTDLVKKAYQEAVDRKYRFYSYGDAMLIL